jgi:hypothetical protein
MEKDKNEMNRVVKELELGKNGCPVFATSVTGRSSPGAGIHARIKMEHI